MVSKTKAYSDQDVKGRSQLSSLDAICIKADLIQTARDLKFPEFSDDGLYLEHHSVSDFTSTLGTPKDDVTNTFTARLLLLLESRPLLGTTVYREIVEEVIAAYWRDYEDRRDNFMPAFLANDILRLWRTFCVNYEARTAKIPDEKKAKRKLKNYKLKHSRLLTCYSALLYLLDVFNQERTVSPADIVAMIEMTPIMRLVWLLDRPHLADAQGAISELLAQYEQFLMVTNASSEELIAAFLDRDRSRAYMGAAYRFGDLMFDLLQKIGKESRFHRLLVV